MQKLETVLALDDPWPARRQRTDELATRYPHAADMLRLYRALLDPQADAFQAARTAPLSTEELAAFAVDRVLPGVIDVTVQAGPAVLRDGVIALFATADLHGMMRHWLAGETLAPIETYMARATCSPILEARPDLATAGERPPAPLDERHCPTCGGLPQLSYFAVSGESLVSGHRYLLCARCGQSWVFSRMTCAACGESHGPHLPIYQEQERFPHARVDGCRSCRRYLLTFDLRSDSRAVPLVDELACLPLDLYAIDQGLTKITPNLMGS